MSVDHTATTAAVSVNDHIDTLASQPHKEAPQPGIISLEIKGTKPEDAKVVAVTVREHFGGEKPTDLGDRLAAALGEGATYKPVQTSRFPEGIDLDTMQGSALATYRLPEGISLSRFQAIANQVMDSPEPDYAQHLAAQAGIDGTLPKRPAHTLSLKLGLKAPVDLSGAIQSPTLGEDPAGVVWIELNADGKVARFGIKEMGRGLPESNPFPADGTRNNGTVQMEMTGSTQEGQTLQAAFENRGLSRPQPEEIITLQDRVRKYKVRPYTFREPVPVGQFLEVAHGSVAPSFEEALRATRETRNPLPAWVR